MNDYTMTEVVPLGNKGYTMIDVGDAPLVGKFSWNINHGYARTIRKGRIIYMHRLINQTPDKLFTDHINQNKLDNRSGNLRNATHYQNMNNISASGIEPTSCGFYVRLQHNGQRLYFGHHKDKEFAKHLYDSVREQLKEAIYGRGL